MSIWDRFGNDWRENCRAWEHSGVAIPPEGDGWKAIWTANPDFLGNLLFYRGHGFTPENPSQRHDSIAVRYPDGRETMIVDVGPPGSFDAKDVLDPAAVEFKGRLFLYYSAVGSGPDQVGLATSDDRGLTWQKFGSVLVGRAPEVAIVGGQILMLAQLVDAEGNYALRAFNSLDGYNFHPLGGSSVFQGSPGDWDGASVATFRIVEEPESSWVAMYGGSASRSDEPFHFGLARSTDFIHWEKHPGNPIFGRGAAGESDGGAIWFPALKSTENGWELLYEGSEGDYSWGLRSQICAAFLPNV